MEFIPLAALPFLINKFLDWFRDVLPDKIEAKVLIPLSWALGVVGTFLFAKSDWGSEMMVGDKAFSTLSAVSLVIVGLVIGATAGIISDFKPARTVVTETSGGTTVVEKSSSETSALDEPPTPKCTRKAMP